MAPEGARDDLSVRIRRSVGWMTVIWVVVFWRLGYLSLLDPDEAHYAQITREMLAAREWLVPHIGGHPFIDKPVLFHWFQAASFAVLGTTEFAARLPTAVAAMALTWTTYWLGRELFDRDTGRRAAAMLLTMPATFALSSIALFDMLFTAFLFGAAACLAVASLRQRPRLQWMGYALLSLAIMTKGPVAILLLAAAFSAALLVRSARGDLLRLNWFAGPLIAVLLASPWFVWMAWRFGREFIDHYVIQGNVWYVTHPYPYRQSNYFFYVRTYFGAFAPWSFLALARAIDLTSTRGRNGRREEYVLMCWIAAVLGIFTLTRFKLDHYIYPAAPALCLISSRAWAAVRERDSPAFVQRATVVVLPLVFFAGAVVIGASMFDLDLRISPYAIVFPIAVTAGAGVCVGRIWRSGWRSPVFPTGVIGTLLVAYASVVVFGYPVLERVRPTSAIGRWISSHQPQSTTVGAFQVDEWEESLRYYSERRLERLDDVNELRAFLSAPGPRAVVTRRRRVLALRQMGVPLKLAYGSDAVFGRTGKGLRRQLWGRLVVAIRDDDMNPDGGEIVAASTAHPGERDHPGSRAPAGAPASADDRAAPGLARGSE
jgi:4-amino-4-deoxy-L-arabinose transferase-like glycosyltransferase